jgi:hypothetical protein
MGLLYLYLAVGHNCFSPTDCINYYFSVLSFAIRSGHSFGHIADHPTSLHVAARLHLVLCGIVFIL